MIEILVNTFDITCSATVPQTILPPYFASRICTTDLLIRDKTGREVQRWNIGMIVVLSVAGNGVGRSVLKVIRHLC